MTEDSWLSLLESRLSGPGNDDLSECFPNVGGVFPNQVHQVALLLCSLGYLLFKLFFESTIAGYCSDDEERIKQKPAKRSVCVNETTE